MPTPSSNQNVNEIKQALEVLTAKVDTVLQGFEARLAKVEQRMDRMEEVQRDEGHVLTGELQQVERRILGKFEEYKVTRNRQAWLILVTTVGWLLAAIQVVVTYLHGH